MPAQGGMQKPHIFGIVSVKPQEVLLWMLLILTSRPLSEVGMVTMNG